MLTKEVRKMKVYLVFERDNLIEFKDHKFIQEIELYTFDQLKNNSFLCSLIDGLKNAEENQLKSLFHFTDYILLETDI